MGRKLPLGILLIPFTHIKFFISSFDALTPAGHFAGHSGFLLF